MKNEKIEILQTANEYLYKLKDGILKLVELIQQENEQQAILLIPEISDGIDWIIKVMELTKDTSPNISLENINEHLQAVLEALDNEDYILLGDIFNYEILSILEEIHNEIGTIVAN